MTKSIIKTDVDSTLLARWKKQYVETRKAMLESLGFKLNRYIIRPSSKRGYHCWWHIEGKPLDAMGILQLQFLLGDDIARCWMNFLRIKRGVPFTDKIFSIVVYRAPLDEKCERCKIRRILYEMGKEMEK